MITEKEERCDFVVNRDDDLKIKIEKMKNSNGNQFVVWKLSERISKFLLFLPKLNPSGTLNNSLF